MSTTTSPLPEVAASPNAAKTEPPPKKHAVVRFRSLNRWLAIDDEEDRKKLFRKGLLRDVEFTQNNRLYPCGTTAEAVGVLETKMFLQRLRMPPDAKVVAQIYYDHSRNVFHKKGHPEGIVTRADYFLLKGNGAVFAGWR